LACWKKIPESEHPYLGEHKETSYRAYHQNSDVTVSVTKIAPTIAVAMKQHTMLRISVGVSIH
jgi:hypothetical protein